MMFFNHQIQSSNKWFNKKPKETSGKKNPDKHISCHRLTPTAKSRVRCMRALSLVAPSEQIIRTRSSCRSVARYNCTQIRRSINFQAKTTTSSTIPMIQQIKLSLSKSTAAIVKSSSESANGIYNKMHQMQVDTG